jgi:hypothetical protein
LLQPPAIVSISISPGHPQVQFATWKPSEYKIQNTDSNPFLYFLERHQIH